MYNRHGAVIGAKSGVSTRPITSPLLPDLHGEKEAEASQGAHRLHHLQVRHYRHMHEQGLICLESATKSVTRLSRPVGIVPAPAESAMAMHRSRIRGPGRGVSLQTREVSAHINLIA